MQNEAEDWYGAGRWAGRRALGAMHGVRGEVGHWAGHVGCWAGRWALGEAHGAWGGARGTL